MKIRLILATVCVLTAAARLAATPLTGTTAVHTKPDDASPATPGR
jgi:hypothetical protein